MQTQYTVPVGGDIDIPCRVEKCYDRNHCNVYWNRNELDNIPPDSQCDLRRDMYGTTHVLSLHNVQQDDGGLYTCSYQITSHLSTAFYLTVDEVNQQLPRLNKTIDHSYKEVNYPEPLVLHCPVISGENTTTNRLVISWTFMNGHDQPQHLVADELRINENYKRGLYICTASNGLGLDSLRIFVEINGKSFMYVTSCTYSVGLGHIHVIHTGTHTHTLSL